MAAIDGGELLSPSASPSRRDWNAFAVSQADGSARMDLAVEGITCAACMYTIERQLGALEGVARARLNLTTHRLDVAWAPDKVDAGRIVARLERLGYRAHPFDPGAASATAAAESKELLRAMAVAGFAMMNVMLLSVAVWAGEASDIDPATRDLFHWLSALIALPAVAYAGRPFYRSAFRALRVGRTNMDVPIAIGVTLTVGLSLWQTMISSSHVFFDSSVMLLFFLLLGRYLDHDMRRRTHSVAENVAALRAPSALLLEGSEAREVPLSKIAPGDLVLVPAGERVSVDGRIVAGASDIDQSLVTGETVPVAVGPDAAVYAGTMNLTGALTVKVSAAAEGTLLDEVNRLLEAAAQAKSRYMKLADRVSRTYAPVVHLAALTTFIGWMLAGQDAEHALVIAISVLIITCPCALALAVPAVQVVASGRLFKAGVLVHSGDAIERLAAVDTIVFDKTGTLTLPEPTLVAGGDNAEALAHAGRLAAASRHPLSATLALAAGSPRPVDGVREVPGQGVEADVEGVTERLGSPAFCGVDPAAVATFHAAHPSASVVAWRRGDEEPVLFGLAQAMRSDARAVIDRLKAMGYALEILSGDRRDAVVAAASELGIERFGAGLTPSDKIARLDVLKAEGRRVLMVGDGLNDAPSLAAAHVSLSPVTAVQVSQAAADAVFLGERLAPVAACLAVARRARAAMIQNLWISVVYNVIAVPMAVAGLVTPLIAALAMSGSSIIVTLNALRLKLGGQESR